MTGAIRQHLTAHPGAVDSRGHLTVGREAMTRAVARTTEVPSSVAVLP